MILWAYSDVRIVASGFISADDPFKIINRPELDDDPALSLPEFDLHAGVEAVRQPLGELLQTGRVHRLAAEPASAVGGFSFLASVTASSVARTDMPSATIRAASSSCCAGVVETEQRARVPGRQHARRDPALHGDRQLQQPDGVRDDGAAAADAVGELARA